MSQAHINEAIFWAFSPPPPPRDSLPPGVVKQDKSSGGSVGTTKARSDPQRVRMSSGERPIGAAKGKQSDTEALCQPPPPPPVGSGECNVLWHALAVSRPSWLGLVHHVSDYAPLPMRL